MRLTEKCQILEYLDAVTSCIKLNRLIYPLYKNLNEL